MANAEGSAWFALTASSRPAAKPSASPSAMNAVDSRTACKGAYTRCTSPYRAASCAKRLRDTTVSCSRNRTTSWSFVSACARAACGSPSKRVSSVLGRSPKTTRVGNSVSSAALCSRATSAVRWAKMTMSLLNAGFIVTARSSRRNSSDGAPARHTGSSYARPTASPTTSVTSLATSPHSSTNLRSCSSWSGCASSASIVSLVY
mmetsp:Transcript_7605/g.19371  ORF Transcript_7605/g.19371 Transcript_7605/m.19371 type:complete len:204 (+) Transcript_7605:3002-3613(+)